jgi:hypothetical protein
MKSAICLVTIQPNSIWIDFLSHIRNYDIYIVLDKIDSDTEIYKKKYPMIHFIKVTNEECMASGYIHSSYMPSSSLQFNEIIAWDRALYYFTTNSLEYDQIWFFEDDCFFYDEMTLTMIDHKYPTSDILCKDKNPQPKDGEWQWFWPAITIHFPPPYFHSPICAVRMSKRLLDSIHIYVQQHKKLFFIEAMFPSIAYRNNLQYDVCEELDQLHWRRIWKMSDFTKHQIFHPVKNIEEQYKLRCLL